MRLVVATRSRHKLREIRQILEELAPVELVDLTEAGVPESPEEEGIECFDTFAENALAKARYFAARSGLPTLADDSGLCVDALGGAPGVRSKRYAGVEGPDTDAANNRRLLGEMEDVPPAERQAHYVCAVAIVHEGEEHLFEGRFHGEILPEPRGEAGFGYDPLFLVPEYGLSFAQLPAGEKNRISHRSRALHAAAGYLREAGEPGADAP